MGCSGRAQQDYPISTYYAMHTFRLRVNERIVGYQRIEGSMTFYSKDAYWWNGTPVEFNTRDAFAGIKDKNDRPLYEHDIVTIRFKDAFRKDKNYRIVIQEDEVYFLGLEKGIKEAWGLLEKTKSITFISFGIEPN